MATQLTDIEAPTTGKIQSAKVDLETGELRYDLSKIKVNLGAPDPPPYDWYGEFNKWNSQRSIESMGDNNGHFDKIMGTIAQPFVSQGYNSLAAWNRGWSHLFTHLDLATQFVERKGLGTRSGLFEKVADVYDENAGYWRHKAEENGMGFFDELISDAVGEAVPGVAQFMLDLKTGLTLPYMAGSQEAYNRGDNPLSNGLLQAAKTGTLGAIFRMAGPTSLYLRAPTLGTVGGFQAAAEAPEGQKAQAFAKGFFTMALYSATSPGGRLGLNEIVENAKPLLANVKPSLEKGVTGAVRGGINWAEFIDTIRQDPIDIRSRLFSEETGQLELPTQPEREKMYQSVVNRFNAIENLDQRAVELGLKLKPGESLRMRSRGYLGISGKVSSVLKDKTFAIGEDGKIRTTGEGLGPILRDYERLSPEKDIQIKEDEFNDYFTATRTIEDLQRPKAEWTPEHIVTEQQVADAKQTISELKAKYGEELPQFKAIDQRLYSFQRRVLYALVDSGNLSFDQWEKIVTQNPHYVPFNRVLDEVENTPVAGVRATKPFTEARSPVKRIKGSELEIEDVVSSIIKNTFRTLDIAERNTVARLVGTKFADVPGSGVTSVPIPIHAIKIRPDEVDTITMRLKSGAQEVRREVKEKITQGETTESQATTAPMQKLEGIVKDSLMSRGFTEGEAVSALTQIKRAAAKRPAEEAPGKTQTQIIEREINTIVKETEQLIQIPTESKIWRPSPYKPIGKIIEYYDNGKKKYIDVPENLYDAMSGMNEVSAGLFTRIFSAPAALLRAGVTLTPDFMIRNFIRDNMDAFIQNTTGFRPFVDSVAAVADVIGRSDLYYDWMRSGGMHSTFVELSQVSLKHMAAELKRDPSVWQRLNIIDGAHKLSMGIEEATRLGIYKAAKRAGKSDVEAMFAAREGTVDFGVHGSNRELRQFSSMTAFFNPGIQGLDRFIRAHTEAPFSTAMKSIAAITIPSILLWMVNKDDPDYNELARWRRDLFWNIRVGARGSAVEWLSIPKPFAIGMIYGSVPERFLNYVYTQDPKALKGLIASIVDSATPVSGDPNGVLLPTAIKPLIENSSNWRFFNERPTVPEARTDLLPEYQYGKYTTETAKIIGKTLGYSPAKIENLVIGWSGGAGRYTLQALDLAIQALSGEEIQKRPTEMADMPVIKAFVGRPVTSDPQSLADFYDEAEEIEAAYASLRDQLKEGKSEETQRILRNHPKLLLSPAVGSIRDSISTMTKLIDVIAKSKLSDEEKRARIQQVEEMRLKTAQAGNKIMESTIDFEKEFQQQDKKNNESDIEKLRKASTQFSGQAPEINFIPKGEAPEDNSDVEKLRKAATQFSEEQ